MTTQLRFALLGQGPQASRWVTEFGSLGVSFQSELAEADALVLAPGARDAFKLATQALRSRLPVLYAAPVPLSAGQAVFLAGLSVRQSCLLRFPELFRHRPGFAFLKRVLGGSEPLWQPLYIRSLRLAEPSSRIDELATEELAMCTSLLGGEPSYVTAAAAHRDGGETCAVFLTLQYARGPLAQCTISLAEGACARQLVAVTAGRTVVLDDLDPMASVRILDGQHLAEGPVTRGAKLVAAESPDAVAAEARLFVEEVVHGRRSLSNAQRLALVAGLWQAARQSIRSGTGQTEPPRLRVIEGGGGSVTSASYGRPSLTLIAG